MIADTLLWSLYIGLGAAGLALALRALPPISRRVLEGKKPWACDVCLSLWCTLAVWELAAFIEWQRAIFLALPSAYTVTLLVLHKLTSPVRPPKALPPLNDLG